MDESEKQKDLRNMLNELLELTEGLSAWEIDFLDSLYNWTGNFSEKQAETLKKIWVKTL